MDCGKDSGQLGGFLFQRADFSRGQQATFFGEFEPQERFVRFFQYPADLVNPVSLAPGATGGTIAGGHGSRGSQDLIGDDFSFDAARERVRHFHYPQRKLLRSGAEFFPIHFRDALGSRDGCRNHES